MKYLTIIISLIIVGCNANTPQKNISPIDFDTVGCNATTPQKNISPIDFDTASQGKRIFVVGGPIGDKSKNTIYDFCDSFDQSICSKKLNKYQGKKGFIVESEPFISDRYYFGYHIILETGEELVLKLSNVYKDKDPIEAALHLVDANKLADAESSKGRPLTDGLSITIQSQKTYGGLIQLTLSNGETITQKRLDERIKYLNDQIDIKNREAAFQTFKSLTLKYDDFEKRWWVKPKSHSEMPVYPYFGKNNDSKWLRLTATYEGYDWIFFEKVAVISAENRYENTFKQYDVKRDNGSGKVWEWIDISATDKELSIIKTLSQNSGKIRFTGKYEATKSITQSQSNEFKALMSLYELTNP